MLNPAHDGGWEYRTIESSRTLYEAGPSVSSSKARGPWHSPTRPERILPLGQKAQIGL